MRLRPRRSSLSAIGKQIGQLDRPGHRPEAAGHQEAVAVLAHAVDDMEKRVVVEADAVDILDKDRTARGNKCGVGAWLRDDADGSAVILPDAGKMRLSRADGAGEDDDGRRPLRPGIDDGDRSGKTLRNQQIIAAGGGIVRKGQGQLLAGLALRISGFHVTHGELFSSSGPGRPATCHNKDRSEDNAKARTGQARRPQQRPARQPADRRSRRARRKSANISQTGCRPTLEPTSFGCRILPSRNWPLKNTTTTRPIHG